jgi:galactose mutarotase-like enzyme
MRSVTHHARAVELPSVTVEGGPKLRSFSLSLRSTTVELCSLGASITKFLVGNGDDDDDDDDDDDIVLGYKDPETAFRSGNPKYFGVVVGRVANRIAKGKLVLDGGKVYPLAINNAPNHLHGGVDGFGGRTWDVEVLSLPGDDGGSAVRFSLTSDDGDQGYPGKISVSATYSLRDAISSTGVVLRLELQAKLLSGKSSPINLAQHSYFNLSKHDDARGILDHQLSLNSAAYTPVDETSIPTREVRPLGKDPAMDWRRQRKLEDALRSYGVEMKGLSMDQVEADLAKRRHALSDSYGFDHNYVVREQPGIALPRVGTLSHGSRTLHVYASAPGVQLYTSNYLDDNEDKPPTCKGVYGPWSGICLETQNFPDSIDQGLDDTDFGAGKCCILTTEKPDYEHVVEYNLEFTSDTPLDIGTDTAGNEYESIEEMWAAQDLTTWYTQAKDYYEDNCSATVNGVLGGIGEISDGDLQGSRDFLKSLNLPTTTSGPPSVACEHGAGIGRVTKGVLLDFCDRSDLVESSARLLYAAPDYIGSKSTNCRFYNTELQDWKGKPGAYTIIWIQWVACYLRDDDLIKFLQRCADSLVEGGVIVLKENTCEDQTFVVDVDDASLTRSLPYWCDLIYKAGLDIHKIEWQQDLPDDIFPVPMIALKHR